MNEKPISPARELYHTILGYTVIAVVVGGGSWFAWHVYKANPQRRLAGTWAYVDESPRNAGGTGSGTRLQFAGKEVRVFDAGGRQIYSLAWTTHQYHPGTEAYPISLALLTTGNHSDEYAGIQLNGDETQMLFMISGDGPSRFSEFRKLP